MDHYYSLSEKRDFIDADFLNSKLYHMGLLPEDQEDQKAYFKMAIQYAGDFLEKYKGKGWSFEYAMTITNDWMDNLEKLSREMKYEADT